MRPISNGSPYKVLDKDGALIGPYPACLVVPVTVKAMFDLTMATIKIPELVPTAVREIMILVVATKYGSTYMKLCPQAGRLGAQGSRTYHQPDHGWKMFNPWRGLGRGTDVTTFSGPYRFGHRDVGYTPESPEASCSTPGESSSSAVFSFTCKPRSPQHRFGPYDVEAHHKD